MVRRMTVGAAMSGALISGVAGISGGVVTWAALRRRQRNDGRRGGMSDVAAFGDPVQVIVRPERVGTARARGWGRLQWPEESSACFPATWSVLLGDGGLSVRSTKPNSSGIPRHRAGRDRLGGSIIAGRCVPMRNAMPALRWTKLPMRAASLAPISVLYVLFLLGPLSFFLVISFFKYSAHGNVRAGAHSWRTTPGSCSTRTLRGCC